MTDTNGSKNIFSVEDAHPFLYHYTSAEGLCGIMKEKQLRASHYSFLNDKQERIGFFEQRLPIILRPTIERVVNSLLERGIKTQDDIDSQGGIEHYRTFMLEKVVEHTRNTMLRFINPFILSMSVPPRNPGDGLLSQWRGYGQGGGYALVFDTRKLGESLSKDQKIYGYASLNSCDVDYFPADGSGSCSKQDSIANERQIADTVYEAIAKDFTQPMRWTSEMFTPMMLQSIRYKHHGFEEENEVRFVACPAEYDLLERYRAAPEMRHLEKKTIEFRSKDGLLIPFINLPLLQSDDGSWPIVKVIVGPHPDQARRAKSVEILLTECKIKAEVTLSRIPFVG